MSCADRKSRSFGKRLRVCFVDSANIMSQQAQLFPPSSRRAAPFFSQRNSDTMPTASGLPTPPTRKQLSRHIYFSKCSRWCCQCRARQSATHYSSISITDLPPHSPILSPTQLLSTFGLYFVWFFSATSRAQHHDTPACHSLIPVCNYKRVLFVTRCAATAAPSSS